MPVSALLITYFPTMPSERKLRIKTLVMVLALVICANIGDLTLKRGMMEIGAVDLTAAWRIRCG